MAYFEWSCDEDVSADDLDAIEAAHPANRLHHHP